MKKILSIIAIITLCSFGNNKPTKVQRRKGVLTQINGKTIFTPLEDWKDYTPTNDTVYQYKSI